MATRERGGEGGPAGSGTDAAGGDRGARDRRVARGRATRERLVATARELFGRDGYDATSIEAVLREAGVARGSLYHHFENKTALFDAVLDQVVAEIAEQAATAARAQEDPVEGLRAGCGAWLRMALDPAIQQIALVDAPAVVGWSRWRELDEQHTLGGVRRALAQIAESGSLPADQVDVLANMLLASVSEAALMIVRAGDPEAALAAGQAAFDTLLDRLASSPKAN
jgi:AcrR family transcriptional regulator